MIKSGQLARSVVLLIVLSGATLTNLEAQNSEFPSTSGNAFVRLCSAIEKDGPTNIEIHHAFACVAYVEGISHGVLAESAWVLAATKKEPSKPFCLPDNVEDGQLVRIALKYIRNHPENAHESGAVLVVESLQTAFPCRDN